MFSFSYIGTCSHRLPFRVADIAVVFAWVISVIMKVRWRLGLLNIIYSNLDFDKLFHSFPFLSR